MIKLNEATIDFMRADLESDMAYSKLIDYARKSIEARGKNFEQEFEKWKLEQGISVINVGPETNASIAERLGVSKRQVSKMRRKGLLQKESNELHECVINEKYVCPHIEINGKMCSSCKIV